MAEYIEREAVLKIIADNCPHDKGGYNTEEEMGAGVACFYIIKGVENIPTADVAPKSEVAREIFAELENILDPIIQLNYAISVQHEDPIERAKAILAEQALRAFRDYLAELKKKYTEGEPNGSK